MCGLRNANPLWKAAALGVLGWLTVCAAARADSVTIGQPADVQNVYPFGGNLGNGPSTRYQQVYNQNLFTAGPITITEIDFFNTFNGGSTASISPNTYTFALSATSKAVNGLDTTNFDANLGPDNTQVYSHFRNEVVAAGSTLAFVFDTPFTYDPSQGNLLMDIRLPASSPETFLGLDAHAGTFDDQSSRAHNFGMGFEGYGLVTRFQYSPAPEPTTLTLAALGGLGLAAAGWRRRRAA
jgi:hypothetical protein